MGCRRKEPPQSHRWPPSSRLAQGVGSALGRGDPHKRAQEGVPPLPVRIGDTPPQTRPSPSVSNSVGEAAAVPQSDSPNTTFLTPSRGVPGPPKNPKKNLGCWQDGPGLAPQIWGPQIPPFFQENSVFHLPPASPALSRCQFWKSLPPSSSRLSRPPRSGARVQDTWLPGRGRGALLEGLGARRSSS